MENEDKRSSQPSGHESHGGHVCHRCGWAFPNPHPSAKHRRAHKKHCGKIEGFRLIDDTSDAAVAAHEKNDGPRVSDEELSDEDRCKKPEELKQEQETAERESSERIEEASCGAVEEGGSGSGEIVVSSDSAAGKTSESYNQLHANKIQGVYLESAADVLEISTQLENNALFCYTVMDGITEHEEISCTHLKELLPDSSIEKSDDTSSQNVVAATSMIVDFTAVAENAETKAVIDMPNISVLSGNLATDCLEEDLKSHTMDEHTEIDVISDIGNAGDTETLDSKVSFQQGEQMDATPQDSQSELFSYTEANDILDEASMKMEVLDSNASLLQGEQMDSAGQDSKNEMFLCTGFCIADINAFEILDSSSDAAQTENSTDIADNCIVQGHVKENLTSLSVLSNMSIGEISKMVYGHCKDHEPTESNLSLIYAGVESGKDPDHLLDTDTALQSEILSGKLDQSADAIPLSIQILHKETGNRTNIDGLKNNLNFNNEHINEASSSVKDVECKTDVSIAKVNVLDCPESIGLECHPRTTNGESFEAQEIALLEPVSSSCESYVAPNQLEVEKECLFDGLDTCHNPLSRVMLENHVEVANGDCAVSDATNRASEATEIVNCNQHGVYEETCVTNNVVSVLDRQEMSKLDSLQSDTKVESETRHHISELDLASDGNKEKNKLEWFELPTVSSHSSSVLGTEVMDIKSGHLEVSEQCSENHVDVADDECAVSDAASRACEATKIVNGNQHVICEETGVINNDVCCRQEICKVDSLPDTKVESEPRAHASESEITSVENKEKNELGRFEQLTMSTLHCSVLGPEVTDINSDCLDGYKTCSNKLNLQNYVEERTRQPAFGNDTDHPVTQKEVQIENIETESSHTKPLGKLEQKVQIGNFLISGPYMKEIYHQKDLQGTSFEPTVGDNTNLPVTHTGVQVKYIEGESITDKQPHEEPKVNKNNEVGLCHHDEQNCRLEEHTTPLVDPQTSTQMQGTLDNSDTGDISEVVHSGACYQSLQEKGDRVDGREQSDAALEIINASRDSNSQTNCVEGQWIYFSDGVVPSPTHATDGPLELNNEAIPIPILSEQIPKYHHVSSLANEVACIENDTDNMDLFEAPSFMTLVEPAMQSASNEIQSMQNPQHPSSPSQAGPYNFIGFQGKNKNTEITEKEAKWESGKSHTPLKILLAEADFESKQKATIAHDNSKSLPAKKEQVPKLASEHPSEPSYNRADHKEWNSPARLPVTKVMKRKGKSTWVPFLCCSNAT